MEEYLIFTGVIIVIQWALAAITRKTIKYYMPFMGYYYVIKHIKEETESENQKKNLASIRPNILDFDNVHNS